MLTLAAFSIDHEIPYDLLLLADPSREMIDSFLPHSDLYLALDSGNVIGLVVLFPLDSDTAEIKNIAVKPEHQGKGIGKWLLENILSVAREKHFRRLIIGTANSMARYQKVGFKVYAVKKDFLIENYPEPIFENGIQASDMIMLECDLNPEA
jgi:aminoglycoside 6'-N-acetyltransferase I